MAADKVTPIYQEQQIVACPACENPRWDIEVEEIIGKYSLRMTLDCPKCGFCITGLFNAEESFSPEGEDE